MLLAAGIGSRFGGIKALAPVGPDGEPLLAISLAQAFEAGFREAVVVVSVATEEAIRRGLGPSPIAIRWARQHVPPGRATPLGTVDAVLSAGIAGNAVIANGDDLYGVDALRAALRWTGGPSTADAAAVLFRLGSTVPPTGGVSRARARAADGVLVSMQEVRGVRLAGGAILSEGGEALAPDERVSMNLWCFRPSALTALARALAAFVMTPSAASLELGLPDAIGTLVSTGELTVDALTTDSTWHGVTWPEDVETVRAALRAGAS